MSSEEIKDFLLHKAKVFSLGRVFKKWVRKISNLDGEIYDEFCLVVAPSFKTVASNNEKQKTVYICYLRLW